MIILLYPTKKSLKGAVGQKLKYQETSLFGPEYKSSGNITGCNRPHLTGFSREFFATVNIQDDLITKVS